MTFNQKSPISFPLKEEQQNALLESGLEYAIANGIVMKKKNQLTASPFALTPSPIPKEAFELAKKTAIHFQEMKHNVANDKSFLESILKSAAEEDEFTRNLLNVMLEAEKQGLKQTKALSISRCDYMLHQDSKETKPTFQQVEMNMISCSFSNLGPRLGRLHRHLMLSNKLLSSQLNVNQHELSQADDKVSQALADAFEAYGDEKAVIMMVVQPGEKNAYDQRFFEYWLQKNKNITMRRYSLLDIKQKANVDKETGVMKINDEIIAVAYFRAGYTPNDYPSDDEWSARLLLETSKAIKCPSVALQLTGLKKVQQVLAQPKMMEKFVADKEIRKEMSQLYAGLWALGDGNDEEIVQKAIETNCASFVLKPQREGGGNNHYDDEATQLLKSLSSKQRRAYILMSRIVTPTHKSLIVRDEQAGALC